LIIPNLIGVPLAGCGVPSPELLAVVDPDDPDGVEAVVAVEPELEDGAAALELLLDELPHAATATTAAAHAAEAVVPRTNRVQFIDSPPRRAPAAGWHPRSVCVQNALSRPWPTYSTQFLRLYANIELALGRRPLR
jgi:hypothetical protein